MASTLTLTSPAIAGNANVPAVIPRCVATDYDGTFATETDHAPTEQTKAMYKLLRQRNVPVLFATGRPIYALRRAMEMKAADLLADLKPCPGVYSNGAVVFGESETDLVDCKLFGEAQMRYVCKRLYEIKADLIERGLLDRENPQFTVCCYGIHRLTVDYAKKFFLDFDTNCAEGYEKEWGCRLDTEEVFQEIAPTTTHLAVAAPYEVLTALFEALDHKELADVANARPVIPCPFQLHILRLDVDKGAALKTLCAKYNYDSKDTMCLGDGMNDIEMLAWAGAAVAMGNASDTVKKYANFVTAKASEDGWAQAVAQFTQQFFD